MMLGILLKLVPALRWPIVLAGQDGSHEQIAITSCISAVKGYFPCNAVPTPDYTCLCEQYLWRISCFDNHASHPTSHPDRFSAEDYMTDYCRAAGSIGAQRVQRNHQRQRRQIGDLLSSIVGDVSSVLSSNGVTVPTAVIESVAGSVVNALPTPANPTSIAAEITATSATKEASSAASTVPTSAALSSAPSSTSSSASSTASEEPASSSSAAAAASSSNKSSGPSTGLIAGVVVGGVAALALIGIFILLLLRHKKKKSRTTALNDKESSPAAYASSDHSPPTNAAYAHVPQQNTYPTTTTFPTQTDTSTQPVTMMSPVSPISPGGQAPWASTSTFGGAAAMGAGAARHSLSSSTPAPRYSEEKPPQNHQFIDSKIPESNEMPTNANVWEIDGREMPPPSELDAGKRDGLNLGEVASTTHSQGQHQQQEYVAYRPPSVENGQANWSGRNGEFLGNRPVGQAL